MIGSPAPPHHQPEGRRGFHGFSITPVSTGRTYAGTGISTRCPSTTPVGLALGPDSPWADWPGPGTLRLSAGKGFTWLIATRACILPPTPPPARSLGGFPGCRTLPYPSDNVRCRGFGGGLE